MIAHVARSGEDRGRVVLQLGSVNPSAAALEAAVRVARAFQSEIESLFVEDAQLFDCAAYTFVREVSLTGRQRRVMSPAGMTRDLRHAAQAARRQLEALARRAEVPLRSRVVRDEPLRALAIACAESGPWNVVALAEPFTAGNASPLKQLLIENSRHHGAHPGGAQVAPRARTHRRRRGGQRASAGAVACRRPPCHRRRAEIVLLLIATDEERLRAWTARLVWLSMHARMCASPTPRWRAGRLP